MREENDRFYRTKLAEYGPGDSRAMGWSGSVSQHLRFRVLLDIGVKPGDSVLDVGCGVGELSDQLYASNEYAGVDTMSEMVDYARQLRPNRMFVQANVLLGSWEDVPEADWVLCSGMLQSLDVSDVPYALSRMYGRCRYGLAVNFESSWAPDVDDDLYLDPCWMLRQARALSSRVVLRHDYMVHDATLYVRRETG